MGCDIHSLVEIEGPGARWRPVVWPDKWRGHYDDEPQEGYRFFDADDRNYDAFAILADVRNGHGFAGVDTGDGFVPISTPRGYPADISPVAQRWLEESGDHSTSYVTLRELLDYDWAQVAVKRGVVSAAEYERWAGWRRGDGEGPESWRGSVSGTEVRNITEEKMIDEIKRATKDLKRWTPEYDQAITKLGSLYTQVSWTVLYSEAAGRLYTRAIPKMRRLVQSGPDKVRLVFNFDS